MQLKATEVGQRHQSGSAGSWASVPTLLLRAPLVVSIGVAVIRGSRHFSWDWPTHAHHHLVGNISTVVGLSVVSLLIVRGPLRDGEAWAWWALVVSGLALFGGYWLGNVTVGFGEPATQANVAQTVLTLSYASGLAVARRTLVTPQRAAAR